MKRKTLVLSAMFAFSLSASFATAVVSFTPHTRQPRAWRLGSQPARPQIQLQPQQPQSNETRVTKDEFEEWMLQLSNWHRWGRDDQLGAVNLITPAKRKQAAALVTEGRVVSLSRDVSPSPGGTAVDASHPFANRRIFNDPLEAVMEVQELYFHGGVFTHLDALCHVAYNGKVYNGLGFREVVSSEGGCSKMGVMGLKDGIVTRAVLLDIPRLKGVPFLEPGTRVYREDIEAWEKQARVRVSPGDAILLRTGRAPGQGGGSGYDGSVIPFLKERDVALVGHDGTQDVGPYPPGVSLPIHRFVLVALGANLIDNLDLEAAADMAAKLNRWEFLLMAAPTPVTNGTGSIINPIAVF